MLIIEKICKNTVEIEDGDKKFTEDIMRFDGDIREGDVIIRTENGRFKADKTATEKRRKEILALQNSLWN